MKLLFDQNISFRILGLLEPYYSKSTQVRMIGLENASDKDIWMYAKSHEYSIVTFDSDFFDYSVIYGSPPKVIWIRTDNQTTVHIADLLIDRRERISAFVQDPEIACLEIINYAP
jgi:predicted nuclease of predicted toxin-antitoxin system